MNFQAAVTFVRNRGNAVEQARLEYVLHDEHPSSQTISDLLSHQRDDGGWSPFWSPDYSSLDATCFRLAQAEQMGVSGSEPPVRRAIQFLAQRQRADGSWEEDEVVASVAPPWVQPGDTSARLYLTANCGFWLARLGDATAAALRAADYLQGQLESEGRLPSFLHAHWLAGGLWYSMDRQEPTERVLNYLGTRLQDMPGSNLAWLMVTLLSASLPVNHALIRAAVVRLEEQQSPDGHWASEDDPGRDVHVTLEALRALRLCGRPT